jgi:hypothetical protein
MKFAAAVILAALFGFGSMWLAFPALSDADYNGQIPVAIKIADDHWPNSPCHGRITVSTATEADLIEAREPPTTGAWADPPTCHVYVVWSKFRNKLMRVKCRMLVHEFGHLAGYTYNNTDTYHSPNRRSVMYFQVLDVPYNSLDCWRRFRSDYLPDE